MAQQSSAASFMFAGTGESAKHYGALARHWAMRFNHELRFARVDEGSMFLSQYIKEVAKHIQQETAEGDPITLAGHSWGGVVAKLVAVELVDSGVNPNSVRLVTIGSPVWPDLNPLKTPGRALEMAKLATSWSHWSRLMGAMLDGSISSAGMTAMLAAQVNYPALDADVRRHEIPALYMRGAGDHTLFEPDFISAARQAGAKTATIDRAGHFNPLDDYFDPATIDEIKVWLDAQEMPFEPVPRLDVGHCLAAGVLA